MKKLMIAAAIVCAAVMSQAATISWGINGGTNPFTGQDIDEYYDTCTAYFFVSSASNGGKSPTLAYATALAAVQAGTFDSFDSAIGTPQTFMYGVAAETGIGDFNADNNIQAYVIITGKNNADKDVMYISDTAPTYITELGGSLTIDFGNLNSATTPVNVAGNWYEVAPEPTSGLLLLVGLAGLALRRRRA